MDCQLYLAKFSEFLDGRTGVEVSREMEAHRSSCQACSRYSEVVETGSRLIRELPSLDVPGDFHPRLDHRIYHLEDGASIARESVGTGATTVSVLAVAALLALSAWAPAAGDSEAAVDLPAVVVGEPSAPTFTPARSNPTFTRQLSLFSTREFNDGIWGDSHTLLREYSPISDRRRDLVQVRTGIE